MIGRAGTGSPEAGVVLRVDPRVLVYTLLAGTRQDTQGPPEARHPGTPESRAGSPVTCGRGKAAASPRASLFVRSPK